MYNRNMWQILCKKKVWNLPGWYRIVGRFMTHTESSNIDFREDGILDNLRLGDAKRLQRYFDFWENPTRSVSNALTTRPSWSRSVILGCLILIAHVNNLRHFPRLLVAGASRYNETLIVSMDINTTVSKNRTIFKICMSTHQKYHGTLRQARNYMWVDIRF